MSSNTNVPLFTCWVVVWVVDEPGPLVRPPLLAEDAAWARLEVVPGVAVPGEAAVPGHQVAIAVGEDGGGAAVGGGPLPGRIH